MKLTQCSSTNSVRKTILCGVLTSSLFHILKVSTGGHLSDALCLAQPCESSGGNEEYIFTHYKPLNVVINSKANLFSPLNVISPSASSGHQSEK